VNVAATAADTVKRWFFRNMGSSHSFVGVQRGVGSHVTRPRRRAANLRGGR
jgi:hypothetical protein